MTSGVQQAIGGASAIAAVSTLGDFIWATWIPEHLPLYGLAHGTLLFLSIGLFLGTVSNRPGLGAGAGALIGGLAVGSFYLLAPIAGYSIMFAVWIGVWVPLGMLNEFLRHQSPEIRIALARGAVAAATSGAAFYLISGIWFPFNPQGWDYLTHFAGWTTAYLPGFAALLVIRRAA
jgi:hypothetical protein